MSISDRFSTRIGIAPSLPLGRSPRMLPRLAFPMPATRRAQGIFTRCAGGHVDRGDVHEARELANFALELARGPFAGTGETNCTASRWLHFAPSEASSVAAASVPREAGAGCPRAAQRRAFYESDCQGRFSSLLI